VYTPEHFRPDEPTTRQLLSGIHRGNLVTVGDSGLVATFLPAIVDPDVGEHGALLAHLARNNDQWKSPVSGEALFIADVVDGYVSPSWYASKAEHGRVVPTWNYVTVHAYGSLVVHDDPAWVGVLVRRLTERHEAGRSDPWAVDDAPREFVVGQLRAIVGVELRITRLQAKVKMSQNRPPADVDGVAAAYSREGRPDLADRVRRATP